MSRYPTMTLEQLEAEEAALTAALEAVRGKVSPWLPIESAPRDGTWVLLIGGKTDEDFYHSAEPEPCVNRAVTGAWIEDECAGASVWDEDYEVETKIDWWVMNYWDGAWRSGYENPTHWQPITTPPPPATILEGDA